MISDEKFMQACIIFDQYWTFWLWNIFALTKLIQSGLKFFLCEQFVLAYLSQSELLSTDRRPFYIWPKISIRSNTFWFDAFLANCQWHGRARFSLHWFANSFKENRHKTFSFFSIGNYETLGYLRKTPMAF